MHRQLSPSQSQSQSQSQPQAQAETETQAPSPPRSSPPSNPTHAPIPPSFTRRKDAILEQLSVPDEDYTDLSPKGTIDAGIRDLIGEINALDGFVTTSSCAGRVSVFLEGRRGGRGGKVGVGAGAGAGAGVSGGQEVGDAVGHDGGDEILQLPGHHLAVVEGEGGGKGDGEGEGEGGVDEGDNDDDGALDASGGYGREPAAAEPPSSGSGGSDGGGSGGGGDSSGGTVAGVGGKGGGGRWLFVSHDPVETQGKLDCEPNIVAALLGMEEPIFDGRESVSADEMSGGESRLIHFKFEPMVCLCHIHVMSSHSNCSPPPLLLPLSHIYTHTHAHTPLGYGMS